MRPLKVILIAVAVAILAIAGTAIFLLSSFDSDRIRREVEMLVAEKTGRTMRIDDKIALSFYPELALALGNVHLSERAQPGREFAAVERVRIAVKVMPLLSQRIEVDQIELAGLKARVIVDRAGRRNIDDLAGVPAPAGTPESAATAKPMPRFEVSGILVERATLVYEDQRTNQNYQLADFSLATGKLANAARGDLKSAGKLTGANLRADFELKAAYRFDLDSRQYGADGISATLRGDLPGVKGGSLAVNLAAADLKPEKEILLDQLSLKASGQVAAENYELALDLPKLQITPERASGAALKLDARLTGKSGPLAIGMLASELKGSSELIQVEKIGLKIDGKRGENSVKADLSTTLKANLPARTLEFAKLVGDIEVANPGMPMKAAKFALTSSLGIDWGKLSARGETVVKADDTTLQGKWSVTRMAPLALAFDLAIDRLNLDRYLPPAPRTAGATPPASGKGSAAGDTPVDLKALQGVDVRGSLAIGALQAANVKLTSLRTDLQLQSGRLELTSYKAQLYDGTVAGSLVIDSRGNKMLVKQRLEGVNINPLLKDAAGRDVLEGRGNVVFDLNTSGTTTSALKRALGGTAALALRDGAVKGINLAKSFRELKAKVGSGQDAVAKASQADKTDFAELSVSFKIANGIARSDDLAAKSPFLRLAGAGDIDIGESRLDYLAKASVVNTSGGQEGKSLEHLKGVTVPVRLSGPFDNLTYKIEFGAVVQDAVKAQVQEKVQQKVEGKLGDKLKGLLKK